MCSKRIVYLKLIYLTITLGDFSRLEHSWPSPIWTTLPFARNQHQFSIGGYLQFVQAAADGHIQWMTLLLVRLESRGPKGRPPPHMR